MNRQLAVRRAVAGIAAVGIAAIVTPAAVHQPDPGDVIGGLARPTHVAARDVMYAQPDAALAATPAWSGGPYQFDSTATTQVVAVDFIQPQPQGGWQPDWN